MSRTLAAFILPLAVFALTSLPGASAVMPYVTLLLLLALLVLHLLPGARRAQRVFLWVLFVLLLVGITGWFYSPFFFALYLAAVGVGFLFSIGTATAFTIALITLFAFSYGEVNPTYDFLTLLSLLSVLPLTIGLRRSFLLVQQERKGILILEDERRGEGVTTLDEILANRINRIGILLRQPITYMKQGLALLREGGLAPEEERDMLNRMQKSTDELFTLVREFESGTTKNALLTAPPSAPLRQPPEPSPRTNEP